LLQGGIMPYFFIRTSFPSGDKFLGPYEPFEVLQRAERLRDEDTEFTITDEDGKTVDQTVIARGDILSPRDEELVKMMQSEFPEFWRTALESAQGHRNMALGMVVRLVRRHIEVAANERERRLSWGNMFRKAEE
jgi:hypothetical protein